jgi:hypothetical protein
MFVHQNVPAANAENKMIEERKMFVENRNKLGVDSTGTATYIYVKLQAKHSIQ